MRATQKISRSADEFRAGGPSRPRSRTRQTVVLVAVIVVALLAGGLAGAELYARHRAEALLRDVATCVVQDGATVSFGVNPPFLWQYLTGHYTDITVHTTGDRVQAARGMTATVTLTDVRLDTNGSSKGTIGALDATLNWKSAGIEDTVAANLPGVGALVTGVRTDPTAKTLIIDAGTGTRVTATPVVSDGDLNLRVVDVIGPLPRDAVQSALDGLTKKLNDGYPLGIKADSVEVTSTGVVGRFSSRDAQIPADESDSCFARI